MPVVTHTVAVFGERPIANAFGIWVSAIATLGLGRLAWTHRRSIIACSSGAWCGRDLVGAHRRPARSCPRRRAGRAASTTAMTATRAALAPAANSDADEHGVDGAEQEEHEHDPELESGVLAEFSGLSHR